MVAKTCARCGNPRKWGKKYCSYACKYAASIKPASEITEAGSRRRAQKVTGPVCEACPSTKKLHVHHVDLNPLNNATENLQTLCRKCHQRWHWIMKKGLAKTGSRAPFGLRYTQMESEAA